MHIRKGQSTYDISKRMDRVDQVAIGWPDQTWRRVALLSWPEWLNMQRTQPDATPGVPTYAHASAGQLHFFPTPHRKMQALVIGTRIVQL